MKGLASRAAAVLAVVAAGCGSTVPGTGTTGAANGADTVAAADTFVGGDGLQAPPAGTTSSFGNGGTTSGSGVASAPRPGAVSAPGSSGGTAPAGGTAASSGGTSAAGSSSSGTTASSPGAQAPAPGAPAPAGPAPTGGLSGRGITDTTIRIGYEYAQTSNSLGAVGVDPADARQLHDVMIEYLNATGGVQGRMIEPDFFVYDYTGASPTQDQDQAACEHFANDSDVAVVLAGGHREPYLQCLQDFAIPMMVGGSTTSDDEFYRLFPEYLEPQSMSLSRAAELLAIGLNAGGYYETAGQFAALPLKIGLVHYDAPRWDRAAHEHLVPELQRLGLELAEEAPISTIDDPNAAGQLAAQVGAAVLRFRSQNVTNVLFIEIDGVLPLFFMNSAESQQYRPRYGITTNDGPDGLSKNIDAAQLENAVAAGWNIWVDVDVSDDPGMWAGRQRCLDILAQAGLTTFASREAESTSMQACDAHLFLRETLNRVTSPLTRESLTTAGEEVGVAGWPSAVTERFLLGPDRHYGHAGYRTANFFRDECACFRYTSDLVPID